MYYTAEGAYKDLVTRGSLSITGTGLASELTLAEGYPLCRFNFTSALTPQHSSSRVSSGEILDATHMTCLSPNATADSNVTLEISYNGHEFFLVETKTPLRFVLRPTLATVDKPFGFANSTDVLKVTGLRLSGSTLVAFDGIGDSSINMT